MKDEEFIKKFSESRNITDKEEYVMVLADFFINDKLSLTTLLLMAIDFGEQHSQWISVEDKLPEEGDTVLVALKNRIMTITTTSYCIDGEWYDNDYKINGIVTHWMPLPKPPKGE